MHSVSYMQAVNEALAEEMERDDDVFIMGEDVTWNLLGKTAGLVERFGPKRVRDTPISEAAFVGAGAGAAMVGLRPVIDMMMAPFMYVAFDQIVSIVAKSSYLYGGQVNLPITIRAAMMYDAGTAAQHSDRAYSTLMTIPGLKIIVPATAYDLKGMLKAAIRDDNPVVCFEDGTLSGARSEVPDEDYTVPLGKAAIRREGTDVTIVTVAGAIRHAVTAAEQLEAEKVSAEVIDLRSIVPMDGEAILTSVAKTGRLVVADPSHELGSVASEISALVAQKAFWSLKSPIIRITTPNTHIPYSRDLESPLYPSAGRIVAAVQEVLRGGNAPAREVRA
jgi:pyruvate dehydrogenase E1 component beta subunit